MIFFSVKLIMLSLVKLIIFTFNIIIYKTLLYFIKIKMTFSVIILTQLNQFT